ncbi:hypothetical protein TNCV_2537721 [Trichonephila clavipes]|nr:hypothetical protein TNCV_2537721 [Trichonephila clavipes]
MDRDVPERKERSEKDGNYFGASSHLSKHVTWLLHPIIGCPVKQPTKGEGCIRKKNGFALFHPEVSSLISKMDSIKKGFFPHPP